MALPVAVGAGEDLDRAGRVDPHLGGFPQAHAGPERAHRLARRDPAGLDIGREADAAQLAVPFGLALALGEALMVGELERLLERRLIVAGVVVHDHRRLVRKKLDEVLPPQLGGIEPQFACPDLDQPLDHEGRFRPARAPIGVDRHRIGVDGVDLAVDVRDIVLARQQRRVKIGRHRGREGRHIGAEIGDGLGLERRDPAVGVERHLGVGDVVAPMRVGEERLGAIGHPFHRPPDLLGGPQAHDLLGIDEDLRAEAAADVGRDHPQLVLGRDADEGRDDEPRHVRVLRRVPQREAVVAGVVVADRRARLHRVRAPGGC